MHLDVMLQDEDIYTFFEPELPPEPAAVARANMVSHIKSPKSKLSSGKSGPKASPNKPHRPLSTLEKRINNHGNGTSRQPNRLDSMSVHEGSSVLDLRGDNYFSCAVGRKRSNARYLLGSSTDVVTLLKELAEA